VSPDLAVEENAPKVLVSALRKVFVLSLTVPIHGRR
jgi:hypothetical protein